MELRKWVINKRMAFRQRVIIPERSEIRKWKDPAVFPPTVIYTRSRLERRLAVKWKRPTPVGKCFRL